VHWGALGDDGCAGDGGAFGSRSHVLGKVEALTYVKRGQVSFRVHEHTVAAQYEQDKPRPWLAVGGDFALETEGLPFAFPFPAVAFILRIARAPKLMRLAKGVVGTLEVGASPSSNGLSSTVPEFELEMLSPRERADPNGDVWFGEPDRPTVVRERRRCWAWAAAVVIGPGTVVGPLLPALAGRVPKRSTNCPAMEERRLPVALGEGRGGELRSEDMASM
jgi:hypothetical protein